MSDKPPIGTADPIPMNAPLNKLDIILPTRRPCALFVPKDITHDDIGYIMNVLVQHYTKEQSAPKSGLVIPQVRVKLE